VAFRSQGHTIQGYLVLPAGSGRHAAVVVVHGSGGDRRELLGRAKALAARGIVALTITEPSTSSAPTPSTDPITFLRQARDVQVRDVVAVRRAVDVLRSLRSVDPKRIGYLGWSAGAKTGTFVAAAEPRVKALALLSAGAAPVSAFAAQAPPELRNQVKTILGSVDPIRYVALARPGSLLLEDGRNDQVVPRAALENIVAAAPKRTTVRWYAARHELNAAAYADAYDWLARKLRV
jgi:dienelactone hydrolase